LKFSRNLNVGEFPEILATAVELLWINRHMHVEPVQCKQPQHNNTNS